MARPISQKLRDAKDEIITLIEDSCRGGEALDEPTMEVLYRMTEADLFRLHSAFIQTHQIWQTDADEQSALDQLGDEH